MRDFLLWKERVDTVLLWNFGGREGRRKDGGGKVKVSAVLKG